MALAGKKTITLDELSQEINIKRYLGHNASESEKENFLELAIEVINQRTLNGKTIHNGKFKKYSKDYAQAKGVSRSSVDLFLDGDMLDNLEGESLSGNKVKINLDGGRNDVEIKKGYNHHVGDTLPKRPWFGLTTKEAQAVADQVAESRDEEPRTFSLRDLETALRAVNALELEQTE